jgi:hypothetical protein
MFKKLSSAIALLFLITGCAAIAPLEVKEGKYGKSVPVITQSFAAPTIRPGVTWKVYLKASDPDGDMQSLYAEVFQYGLGSYPVSITRIKEPDSKDLNGYLYLNTGNERAMQFVNFILTVNIQDKAGHFSAPVKFPLAFNDISLQQSPPSGIFQEKDLGPIMVTIRSSSDADRGGRDFK